jgi:hypothetical protein
MISRLFLSLGVLLGIGVVAIQAHEVRQIGAYTLAVGFRAEPAFEDVVNAVDIFVNRTAEITKPSASGMATLSTSRWRCNSGTPRTSTRPSWRRHHCRSPRARILRPATAIIPGSSRPMMASMPSGSRAALRIPAIPTQGRRRLIPPLCVAAGRRAPPPALTAWPIHNPSQAHSGMAIGIIIGSSQTRGSHSPRPRPRTGAWALGLLTHAMRTRKRLCTSCSLSWSCCSGCRVETPRSGLYNSLPSS